MAKSLSAGQATVGGDSPVPISGEKQPFGGGARTDRSLRDSWTQPQAENSTDIPPDKDRPGSRDTDTNFCCSQETSFGAHGFTRKWQKRNDKKKPQNPTREGEKKANICTAPKKAPCYHFTSHFQQLLPRANACRGFAQSSGSLSLCHTQQRINSHSIAAWPSWSRISGKDRG